MILVVNKWGNSLAMRIPIKVATDLNLKANTKLEIINRDGEIILKKIDTLEEMCAKITPQNLNIDSKWIDEPSVGEEW